MRHYTSSPPGSTRSRRTSAPCAESVSALQRRGALPLAHVPTSAIVRSITAQNYGRSVDRSLRSSAARRDPPSAPSGGACAGAVVRRAQRASQGREGTAPILGALDTDGVVDPCGQQAVLHALRECLQQWRQWFACSSGFRRRLGWSHANFHTHQMDVPARTYMHVRSHARTRARTHARTTCGCGPVAARTPLLSRSSSSGSNPWPPPPCS